MCLKAQNDIIICRPKCPLFEVWNLCFWLCIYQISYQPQKELTIDLLLYPQATHKLCMTRRCFPSTCQQWVRRRILPFISRPVIWAIFSRRRGRRWITFFMNLLTDCNFVSVYHINNSQGEEWLGESFFHFFTDFCSTYRNVFSFAHKRLSLPQQVLYLHPSWHLDTSRGKVNLRGSRHLASPLLIAFDCWISIWLA